MMHDHHQRGDPAEPVERGDSFRRLGRSVSTAGGPSVGEETELGYSLPVRAGLIPMSAVEAVPACGEGVGRAS
ncbi:MAG: hypothetical protein ACRDRK_23775 [Pseudonocardia sp.]